MKKNTDADVLLSINIGNDVIALGLSEEGRLTEVRFFSCPERATVDEAEAFMCSFLESVRVRGKDSKPASPQAVILASVVPLLTATFSEAGQRISGSRPLTVGPGLKTGLRMRYNDPAEIGADRIANLVAASSLEEAPFIVADFGTSTNLSIVDKEGAFCGGLIAPGIRLSAQALSREAAQLASVDFKMPKSVIGKNTQDALRAGIVVGEAARVDGLVEAIWNELGYETSLIATGQDASLIQGVSKHIERIEKTLSLQGLNLLYRANRRR